MDFPDGLEDEALGMVPSCSLGDPEDPRPTHHFVLVGHPGAEDAWFLECHYGDAAGDEINLEPGPYNPVCVGA